ncbi:MAG: hypothetical protein LCH32_10230 [Bacteroidetes bacterium]|nr:hypothetical protein [Bacteroidota bacterium]
MGLIQFVLIFHIFSGSISLVAGLFAILLRNKVTYHKKVGKIYFYSMTAVFISAIILAVNHKNIFLFCVSFFSYYSCLTAYRSLHLKQLHINQKPLLFDWIIEAFFGFIHIGFVLFSIYILFIGRLDFGIISLIFGAIGLRGNYITYKRLKGHVTYKSYWLMAHIGGMLGSYIGAITAFLVNNNNRWIQLPNIVAWIGPTAFIVPLIIFELKKHKKHTF